MIYCIYTVQTSYKNWSLITLSVFRRCGFLKNRVSLFLWFSLFLLLVVFAPENLMCLKEVKYVRAKILLEIHENEDIFGYGLQPQDTSGMP